jgi:hypothetical protein
MDLNTDEVDKLLRYLPVMSELTGNFEAQWVRPESREPGVINESYPQYPAPVEEFFATASQEYWADHNYDPFSLGETIEDDAAIASATFEQIRALLTYCVRGERFCEGHWGAMVRGGQVVSILRRLQQLREAAS